MATTFLDEAGLKELLNKISTWGTGKFQPKGNYQTAGDYQPKGDYETIGSSIASISSMSGGNRIITYTMTTKSGTTAKTGTFTYKDTTYSTGNTSTAGITKLYTAKATDNNGAYGAAALSGTASTNGSNLVGYDGTTYTPKKLDGTDAAAATKISGTTVGDALDQLYSKTGTSEQKISDIKDKLTAIDTKLGNTTGSLSDYVLKSELAAYEVDTEYGATLVGVGDLTSSDGALSISGSNLQDVLKEMMDYAAGLQSSLTTEQTTRSNADTALTKKFNGYVPTSRTINGKALTANITLAAGDIGYTATIGTKSVTKVDAALNALNEAVAAGIQFVVVDSLPTATSGKNGVIYLVKMASSTSDTDYYEEYVKVKKTKGSGSTAQEVDAWERLGSTGSLKLTDYWAKADLVAMTTTQVDSLCDANLL